MKLIPTVLIGVLLAVTARAEVAVIVHTSNSNTISQERIAKIFLGKQANFPNGSEAEPVNLTVGNTSRENFDSGVLGKNTRQMKAYWSKLEFTGKGTPPKEVDDDAAMIQLISSNPHMIGYVDSDRVTGNVKVIHTF